LAPLAKLLPGEARGVYGLVASNRIPLARVIVGRGEVRAE
jgi:hypothetical protein